MLICVLSDSKIREPEERPMTYQLPPDIDQRVQSQIALGIYQTPDQVLNEALDALDQRNEDVASIQRGIEAEKAGRLWPLHTVDLTSRGIDEQQAADLRQRLRPFTDDWDRPEMDAYD